MRTEREAAVIVRRGEQFLMLHRVPDDYWHVVAGVVEPDESFAEAAGRELVEETGLHAAVADLAMPQSYPVPETLRHEYGPGTVEVTIGNFSVEVPPEWEPTLNEEHDRYRWCDLSEATLLEHWPETAEIMAALAAPWLGAR
ncbi:MAG TPA: NUDIX domain-containing protein [Candidatus Limnocylindria bacterium]|nr:NUDIX domain-containing protein [Candidatus Limnocylindria bacterium]